MKVLVNQGEFIIGIRLEVEEFIRKVIHSRTNLIGGFSLGICDEVLKPETDVSGRLNDGMHDLRDGFMLVRHEMIAKNGLLESGQRHDIAHKSLASI